MLKVVVQVPLHDNVLTVLQFKIHICINTAHQQVMSHYCLAIICINAILQDFSLLSERSYLKLTR